MTIVLFPTPLALETFEHPSFCAAGDTRATFFTIFTMSYTKLWRETRLLCIMDESDLTGTAHSPKYPPYFH